MLYIEAGEAGSRQKENSKELHKFTRMQPIPDSQNRKGRSRYGKGILSIQKNGKVWPAGHIKSTRDWVKALKASQI